MPVDNVSSAVNARPGTRILASVLIAIYLAVQLLLPLRYYSGASQADPRFSWRMFSSTGQKHCLAKAYEIIRQDGKLLERPLQLDSVLPRSWLHILKTSHQQNVVEEFLSWYCQRPGIVQVRYESDCTLADGTQLPRIRLESDRKAPLPRKGESLP
jgi:hypothetical protein